MLADRLRPSANHQRQNFKQMITVIGQARRLPSPPEILARLTELLADPEYKSSELVAVVSMDPAIATEVLNLANSAFYTRSSKPVTSIQKAIETIGDRPLTQLLVARSAHTLRSRGLSGYKLNGVSLWRRSLTAAVAAGWLARIADNVPWSHAYTVGLLMDIGHLAMGNALEQRMADPSAHVLVRNLDDYELHMLGIDHAELGRRLARQWKLPEVVTSGIAYHHRPADAGEHEALAYVVHGADAIVSEMYGAVEVGGVTSATDPRWIEIVGVTREQIDGAKEQISKEVDQAVQSLGRV